MSAPTATINEQRLMEFVFKAVGDIGKLTTGALVVIGDKLGLYRAWPRAAR